MADSDQLDGECYVSLRISPGSPYFAEQYEVRERLAYALKRSNAVLLYGGRQAGKTTLLRFVHDEQSEALADINVLSSCELFIYTDLSRLRYDASPPDFFQLLATRALNACKSRVIGFEHSLEQTPVDLDGFVLALQSIAAACYQLDVRFIFLLDEAKRVLGSRFPRGFQDNLFSLLFGEAGEQLKVAMVFAGNQHLNEFLKDDTSPIGSRSLSVHLSTLSPKSLQRLVATLLEETSAAGDAIEISNSLISITGGHAGLTARLLESTLSDGARLDPRIWVSELAANGETLFENWILSMSPEARDFTSVFVRTKVISIQALASWLENRGLNKFFARRVFDEYEYTGIAKRSGDELLALNPLFWDYVGLVTTEEQHSANSENVWSLIEETELSLRQLILSRFRAKFGDAAHERMKRILGDKNWDQITSIQAKSQAQYRYSRDPHPRDLMSCMYLGQLGMLMTNGATWDMFKSSFRDKRELEDKLACVMPVRNDRAHFSSVPDKEMERCRIACDDLLTIAERELDAGSNGDTPKL